MSGDSTNECSRYLFAGSIGSSIRKDPAALVSVPLTVSWEDRNLLRTVLYDDRERTLVGLTSFVTRNPPMLPKLDRKRAQFVLSKIDEILAWEQHNEAEKDTKFVELGRYLCEVRAGQSAVAFRIPHTTSDLLVSLKILVRPPATITSPEARTAVAEEPTIQGSDGFIAIFRRGFLQLTCCCSGLPPARSPFACSPTSRATGMRSRFWPERFGMVLSCHAMRADAMLVERITTHCECS